MLPFFGKVHVAYIPNGKVIGLSKIPRLIEIFSRRLQIQDVVYRDLGGTREQSEFFLAWRRGNESHTLKGLMETARHVAL